MGKINNAHKFELIVRFSTAALTLCLVVVGIWYTVETGRMRIAAESEMEMLKKQFQYSMMPDLYPTVAPKKFVTKHIMDGKITQQFQKKDYTKEELVKFIKYYVAIENVGNRCAYDAYPYLYNCDTKSFMKAQTCKVFVTQEKPTSVMFADDEIYYITKSDIVKEVKERYNINIDSVDNYLKLKDKNCLFLFYKDIQGKVYLRTRGFQCDDEGNVIHLNTDFFELN